MTFEWPWQYNFPPFFTVQPNLETRARQTEAWSSLVLAYHKHRRLYRLDVAEAETSELFYNHKIDRRLSREAIVAVLDDLETRGHVEWDNRKERRRCFVMWRTLEEWAKLVFAWVSANGMTDTVCTLYELHSGDNTTSEEFHAIDMDVLRKALRVLEQQGKAQVFSAEDPHEEGVKFFS